ncbi:Gfo/Idh/MocA family oxidoreductase [Aspergillus lucknowensis]|uniref:Gfo/Idh/MocA-like oxidoreductase N-terminal domain-containing protein n=1 Tax=Aspergillus lucknowensis TaxID=176173 RepID=A0ABR4L8I3_9EURO
MASRIVRVGVIGCGEIAQVAHIPTFNFLSDYFQVTYLCDISANALEHCRRKVAGSPPKITKSAEELCSAAEVDAVLVCNASAYHTEHALLALKNNKSVLVEKPLTSSHRDIDQLQAAEKASKGRLMVGYMRRYAKGFLDAIAEIGGISQIQYVRVRDIIGHNSASVAQSGTFPKRFDDYAPEDSQALKDKERMAVDGALSTYGVPSNDETRRMLMLLGGLGTHDLSAMRESIGMPKSVKAAVLKQPIWTATFDYGTFPVVYESGVNQVPLFDAHIEVYGPDKIVRVNYDTPYIKGLPTTMTVREKTTGPRGEGCYQERYVRTTYEDNYTVEFKEWYESIVNGKEIKTTIEDARQDVDLIQMLMREGFPSVQ